MSRAPVQIAADILLNPMMLPMVGLLGYMLYSVVRAGTASGRDHAAVAARGMQPIPVKATFAGIRGLPPLLAVATNNAGPLFAVGPTGIEYRVLRKRFRAFGDIERIDLHRHWRTVNIEFRFRGDLLTLAVNAGTDPVARTILRLFPADVPMTVRAAALRAG